MDIKIKNELHCTELVIESNLPYEEDYQVRMIQENSIAHIVKVVVLGRDGNSVYSYDITGMKSLRCECEKLSCSKVYMEQFLRQLLDTILEMNNYMLDMDRIILDPEYIFEKDGIFYFCYFPQEVNPVSESFHHLAEFFVQHIDYSDYSSVMLACELHKETMEEQYDLTTLIPRYMQGDGAMYMNESQVLSTSEGQEEGEVLHDYNAERAQIQREDSLWEEDREETREVKSVVYGESPIQRVKDVLRETPVHRYWMQKQKERWGSWDDLLSQEESSIMEQN